MQRRGFTLLELSIVLVIIGLIIGGVTVGSELIGQAKIGGMAKDAYGYQTAIRTFQLKYRALPGDLKNATSYWPSVTANGNGDGRGGGDPNVWSGEKRERVLGWQHMALAGIVKGTYTGDFTGGGVKPGESIPAGPLEGSGYYYNYQYDDVTVFQRQGQAVLVAAIGGTDPEWLGAGVMTASTAQQVDKKYDDGIANSGRILGRGGHNGAGTGCINGSDQYALSETAPNCVLWVFQTVTK